MSEVLSSERFLADAKGQTNALVSKKSVSKIEAWVPAMISDGKGITVTSVYMCVFVCVILKKIPSFILLFNLNLTGKKSG